MNPWQNYTIRRRLVVVDCEAFHVRQQGAEGNIFGNEHVNTRTFKLEITGSFGEFGVGTADELHNCLGPSTDGVLLLHNNVVGRVNEASIEFTSLGVW